MPGNKQVFSTAMNAADRHRWDCRWTEALQDYQRALAEFPEDVTARSGLGFCYMQTKQWQKSLSEYESVLCNDPSNVIALSKTAELYGILNRRDDAYHAYLHLADLYAQAAQGARAEAAWQKAGQLSPGNPEPYERLAGYYFEKKDIVQMIQHRLAAAQAYLQRNQLMAARLQCEEVLRADGTNSLAQQLLRHISSGRQDPFTNEQQTRRRATSTSSTIRPDNIAGTSTKTELGDNSSLSSLHQDAASGQPATDTATSGNTSGGNAGIMGNMGSAGNYGGTPGPSSMMGGSGSGMQSASQTRITASQVTGALQQAQIYQNQGRFNDAIDLCEQILVSGFERPDARYFLGWLYQEQRRWDEAIQQFQYLLNDADYALSCYYALGQCYRARGDLRAATVHFDEAVDRVNLDALTVEESDQLVQLCQEAAEAHRLLGEQEQALTVYNALLGFLRSRGWNDKVSQVEFMLKQVLSSAPAPLPAPPGSSATFSPVVETPTMEFNVNTVQNVPPPAAQTQVSSTGELPDWLTGILNDSEKTARAAKSSSALAPLPPAQAVQSQSLPPPPPAPDPAPPTVQTAIPDWLIGEVQPNSTRVLPPEQVPPVITSQKQAVPPMPDPLVQQVPMQQMPVQQSPVQQVPMQQMPVQQSPVQQVPMQQMSVQQSPVQQVPMQQMSVQSVPVQQVPMQQMPVQSVPVQQVPMQQMPVQQSPVQQVPMQQMPVQPMSVQQVPMQQMLVQPMSVQQVPMQQMPVQPMPVQQVPMQQMPVQPMSVQQAPAQYVSVAPEVAYIPPPMSPQQVGNAMDVLALQVPSPVANAVESTCQSNFEGLLGQITSSLQDINIQNVAEALVASTAYLPENIRLQVVRSMQDIQKYVNHGLWTPATDECLKVINIAPQYLDVHQVLCEIYVRQGKMEQAITKFAILVDTYIANGRIDDAIATYRRILQLEPNNITYRMRLINLLSSRGNKEDLLRERTLAAETYLRLGYIDRAMTELEQALQENPTSIPTRLNYALALQKLGSVQQSVAEYQRVLQIDPRNLTALVRWHLLMITVQTASRSTTLEVLSRIRWQLRGEGQKHADTVLREYIQALDVYPDNADTRFSLGSIYHQCGLYDKATDAYSLATCDGVLSVLASVSAAQALLSQGRPEAAIQRLEQALQAVRQHANIIDPATWAARPREEGEEHQAPEIEIASQLAKAYGRSGKTDQMLALLQHVKHAKPMHDEVSSVLSEIPSSRPQDVEETLSEYMDMTRHYRSNRQIDNAIHTLNEMVRLAPQDIRAHGELADIYIKRGQLDEGIAELRLLADLFLWQNQLERAGEALQQVGNIYAEMGNNEEALTSLFRAAELDVNSVGLQREIVGFCLQLGHHRDAAKYQEMLARHYFETHQVKEAVAALQQLITIDRTNYEAYDMLGQTYQSVGEYEQASRVYRNLAKVNPNSPIARDRLAALQSLRLL